MSTIALTSRFMSSVPKSKARFVYYQAFVMPSTQKVGFRLWAAADIVDPASNEVIAKANEPIFAVRMEAVPGKTLEQLKAGIEQRAQGVHNLKDLTALTESLLACNVEGKDPVVLSDPEFDAGRVAPWGSPRQARPNSSAASRPGEAGSISW